VRLQIKRNGGVPFARKAPYEYDGVKYEADLKGGDIITILDAGVEEEGQYGKQFNFKIKTRNGEKKFNFNQKTQNVLIEEFGDDSEKWIGKNVKVILKKDTIAGKKVEIAYLVVDGWKLDEYGDLVKEGQTKDTTNTISPEDIPF
jgi:hypothetical protein